MAGMMALAQGAQLFAGAASTIMQSNSVKAEGEAAEERAELQAQQLNAQAKADVVSGQRRAQERNRRTDLLQSSLQATAAAGGFSATDIGTTRIAQGIEERGAIQAGTEMALGQTAAKGKNNAAAMALASGKNARSAANHQSNMLLFSGATDFAANVGMKAYTPKATNADPWQGLRYPGSGGATKSKSYWYG